MLAPIADQRILRGTAATLSVQLRDQDGEAAAPVGTVTVDVSKADGTAVITGGSTSGSASAPRTYALSAANNANLELFTVVWKDGGTERLRTLVEAVSGFYFSIAEVEAFDTSLGDITDAGTVQARARRVRDEVERECERITRTAWVKRYRRLRVDGTGRTDLILPEGLWNPRTLRSAAYDTSATTSVAFSAAELAAVDFREYGALVRRDGNVWPAGTQNLVLELEHGYDRPPEDLRHAAMSRFRARWNMETGQVGAENAERFTTPAGLAYDIASPEQEVGQVEVFRVYKQHSKRVLA